jgi:hypothetical protein
MTFFNEGQVLQLALGFNRMVEGMFLADIFRKSSSGLGIEKDIVETVVYEDLWCDYQNISAQSTTGYGQSLIGSGAVVERKVFLPRFGYVDGEWKKIEVKVDDLIEISEADGTSVGKFKITRLDPFEDHWEALVEEVT